MFDMRFNRLKKLIEVNAPEVVVVAECALVLEAATHCGLSSYIADDTLEKIFRSKMGKDE